MAEPNGQSAPNGTTSNGRPSYAEKHKLPAHFIGGNRLENAPPSKVKDFVAEHGGHTVITNVLIANNGIAAVKEIRSVRKWAYETFGDERAIKFTVMATPEDLQANADYIRMADHYVEVPGGTNNHNYANVELIVDVAERMDVHAVWAGWGHASENPKLPESLAASPKKIVFIGPPGSAMRSLGDKISSTIVAQHANVPTIPWSGSGVSEVHIDENGIVTVPEEVYLKGCVNSWEEGLEKAREIGFPVMIKASEGGGGKGIRKCMNEDQFEELYKAAAAEIPGSPIFIMKLADSARHLEVQLLADQYGNNISLFGRDCSVQRRHQKIIEEAPVTIASPTTFRAMEEAAVRLGKLVGYVSAGTVEYLYSHADDKFYFLELNPRLQVEHPTTEMVSGVNLPAAQLQIAMGIPLHRIRDIRLLYGVDPKAATEIDFEFKNPESEKTQRRPAPKGHTTACRITSEDPGEGFKPSSGMLQELNFRSSSNVWGYFSVGTAGGIHSFSDSQFGHIFAYGENRAASRKHMIVALKELSIRGDFRTTVEYLIKLLETQAFEENTITTGWLDELISKKLTAERPDTNLAIICGAVIRAHTESEKSLADYRAGLEKGQVPSKDILKTVSSVDFIYEGLRYKFTVTRSSVDTYRLFINGSQCEVGVRTLSDGGLLVLLGGHSHNVYWKDEATGTRISIDGKTCLLEQENDPTQLRTPSPGKLVKYTVESGSHIRAGQTFAEVEVMKMYMPLVAQEDGIVQFIKQPGATLEAGDILGILALDDPSRVKQAQPFVGQLPQYGSPVVVGSKPAQRFAVLYGTMCDILNGYDNQVVMQQKLKEFIEVLRDPKLPYSEFSAQFSALHARMPHKLDAQLTQVLERAQNRGAEFPARQLLKVFNKFLDDNVPNKTDQDLLKSTLEPLTSVLNLYLDGQKARELNLIADLLSMYADVECQFSGRRLQDEEAILKLRDQYKDNIQKVVNTVLSHKNVMSKNSLVLALLDEYRPNKPNVGNVGKHLRPVLRRLTELESRQSAKVSLKAREVLILCALPSLEERTAQMEHILRSSVVQSRYGETGWSHRRPDREVLKEVVDSKYTVFDVLTLFFAHEDPYVALAALEVYVRRAYRAYNLREVRYHDEERPYFIDWDFALRKSGANQTESSMHMQSVVPSSPATPVENDFKRIHSISDMTYLARRTRDEPIRKGVIVPCKDLLDAEEALSRALEVLPLAHKETKDKDRKQQPGIAADLAQRRRPGTPLRLEGIGELSAVVNVAVRDAEGKNDEEILALIKPWVQNSKADLLARRVRRLTFICGRNDGSYPSYYTFRGPDYAEDDSIRHIEPSLAFQLELGRLSKFKLTPVFTQNKNIHVYEAVGRGVETDRRYFTRAVVRPGRLRDEISTAEYLISEADRVVNDIFDALEIIGTNKTDLNHMFINFSHTFQVTADEVAESLQGFLDRFGPRGWRLRVHQVEIRINCMRSDNNDENDTMPLRVIITNTSGFVIQIELYEEKLSEKGEWVYYYVSGNAKIGSMHLLPVSTPYPTKNWLQPKRYKAHILGTQYVYDFPELFRQAIQNSWTEAVKKIPSLAAKQPAIGECIDYNELVLGDQDNLAEVSREPGMNSTGMVGWLINARTPEYPDGRKFIVVANDITFKIGSFGPKEDTFFFKCTELARKMGIPRIYLSANSGARLGLAEELMPHFNVAWNDPAKPEAGFKYLYLSDEAKRRFENEVITEEIVEDGEKRHKIITIVGAEEGLGVECLRGSGLIAGATSRAYNDIFTCTLVTCRSVGIGAYLVRLGQRAVQVEGQPIILTGAPALNSLLGREVYTSNLQLGGTQIMYRNGVSHLTAKDDFDGVTKIVQWLSFIPDQRNNPLPILSPSPDPWDRDVVYTPPYKQTYDVRWMIAGKEDEDGFQPGLFDKDSFVETLGGWARTVVVGRARLGGIPMGVIAVETRTIENITPADPANPDSIEQVTNEAGGVWYPNSAFKTAQAINDFNYGEQLPLMILANWRGFSGGQRDMYNEVLKYGSFIVDALTRFEKPIFIYIPPHGELRGGSWVVVDPTINPASMEMYADEEARGGVLEPEGIIPIKYKKDKQLETMARLDPVYRSLKKEMAKEGLSKEESDNIKKKMQQREELLLPIYHQICVQFADLHDRAGRMKAKGVIRQSLQWRQSRRFFYWRVRRRLIEDDILRRIEEAINPAGKRRHDPENTSLAASPETRSPHLVQLESWVGIPGFKTNDREVVEWYEQNQDRINEKLEKLKKESIADQMRELLRAAESSNPVAAWSGVRDLLRMMPVEEREKVVEYLKQV
ncbi:acetyl-CoA carboxylase-like protein [Thermochaetoides thermophila DSM 1495]|uniref:Acetyl-CoA carboxylase-like protein n=1 Tax=Chaetomium thermophilum (strain DSM 1495 / CBS 144.50 / IMI 039719) TaxID=759272 RepID=G0S3L5_CHATD|nr:acetyl-CoA carboxylase-like protein [Thermochaetoides thermophila DSM 1495]EGS20342.1 acetyl-CoA carboxylase-like protein [Thermochaetoides thermophila DSM 1495]